MPDWTTSMIQSYEYYIVEPGTWKNLRLIDNVKSCTINRDYEADTLGSASIDIGESLDECYIRSYLITTQNNKTEKHPLGTFLVQTPSSKFDGKTGSTTMDAYTPLIELKEKKPDLGYYIPKNSNVMEFAYNLARENMRAPVVKPSYTDTLYSDFVADPNDTLMSFTSDLIKNAKCIYEIDELGRILFAPQQDTNSMQPIWTYDDGNCSILYPDFTIDQDLYGIPNVVEVIYSDNTNYFYSRIVNDDPLSPTSTISRGRVILYRDTNPSITSISAGMSGQAQIDEYAKKLLEGLSTVEHTITYKHGYCPVRLGDCVRINLTMSNSKPLNVKARVISQSIKCEPGCPVTEKAIYTTKLWG